MCLKRRKGFQMEMGESVICFHKTAADALKGQKLTTILWTLKFALYGMVNKFLTALRDKALSWVIGLRSRYLCILMPRDEYGQIQTSAEEKEQPGTVPRTTVEAISFWRANPTIRRLGYRRVITRFKGIPKTITGSTQVLKQTDLFGRSKWKGLILDSSEDLLPVVKL
nr:hypothetical protein Iba_chr02bCG19620 [Ipomoea batatas]